MTKRACSKKNDDAASPTTTTTRSTAGGPMEFGNIQKTHSGDVSLSSSVNSFGGGAPNFGSIQKNNSGDGRSVNSFGSSSFSPKRKKKQPPKVQWLIFVLGFSIGSALAMVLYMQEQQQQPSLDLSWEHHQELLLSSSSNITNKINQTTTIIATTTTSDAKNNNNIEAKKAKKKNVPNATSPNTPITTITTTTKETVTLQQQGSLPSTTPKQQQKQRLVVDVLSIGSQTQMDLLMAQKKVFESHASVRNFVYVTEQDDYDSTCHQLSNEDAYEIAALCKKRKPWMNVYQKRLAMYFATGNFLQAKTSNPIGWLCSQQRPIIGMVQVLASYRDQLKQEQQAIKKDQPSSNNILPDYLIVVDADTYINMDRFESYFSAQKESNKLQKEPIVTAGCSVRFPMDGIHFVFPWGGFGAFYNQYSIEKLMRPIHCPNDVDVCHRIYEEDMFNEQGSFQNGMSIIELMEQYTRDRPFSLYSTWQKIALKWRRFCFHSDWIQGYLINFYNVSRHYDLYPKYANVAQERLFSFQDDSGVYGPDKGGQCLNEDMESCPISPLSPPSKNDDDKTLVCHHLNVTFFQNMLVRIKKQKRVKDDLEG